MIKEKDIIHENGRYWVLKEKDCYTAMKSGVTHSVSIGSWLEKDLAIAYVDYKAKNFP